ncbi:GGDEF domain-containing phosphodiesterase [Arthrobacter sp. UYEF3]|uniref:GGDEF domain-containing phosphodiesterase n=1 Tax=Arthrobacter sp. UYEF3 TaxID=1756365 RepID=UPI003393F769
MFRHAALYDPLTGLANRRHLEERGPYLMGSHDAAGTAILYVDLDDFKVTNDTFGHRAGDAVRQALIRRRLPHGLSSDGFSLHYQPLMDIATGACPGVEALLRWEDAGLGTVCSDEFIHLAEQSGDIHAIGRCVMNQACAPARKLGPGSPVGPAAARCADVVAQHRDHRNRRRREPPIRR